MNSIESQLVFSATFQVVDARAFQHGRTQPVRRRTALEARLRVLDDAALRGWLDALDPETAASLREGGGRQRMLRALEVALLTGHSLAWWHRHAPPPEEPVPLLVAALDLDRDELDRRIDRRLGAMVRDGLLDEVRTLLDAGVAAYAPGMTATGYREIVAHLRGDVSLEEAVAQIRRATRQYARRQRTWFRNQLGAETLRLDGAWPVGELAAAVVSAWEGERN